MISTVGHPIYKQFISRLHLFNHNFLIYHVTVLLSVGPLYATIQEYFFKQTDKQVVRRFDNRIYRSMFWKTKGGTWFHRDTLMILYLYYNRHRILWYCIIFAMWFAALLIVIVLFREKRRHTLTALTLTVKNYYSSLKKAYQRSPFGAKMWNSHIRKKRQELL
jgi:general stress protein CsbA